MKNKSTIKAVIAALKWHAQALEDGDIECVYISHEDLYRESALGGSEDSGIREFKFKYVYKNEETEILKELF